MKKILLHIGYPKTGTTSLKKIVEKFYKEWFYLNKEEGGNNTQKRLRNLSDAIFIHNENDKINLLINNIIKSCKNLKYQKFFFSVEDILGFENIDRQINLILFFKIIKKLEKFFNIEVLITIRSQSDMVESNFAYNYHNYFNKFSSNINEFFDHACTNKILINNLNFDKILKKIILNKKKIHILPLEYIYYPVLYKKKVSRIFKNNKKIYIFSENVTTTKRGGKKIIRSLTYNYLLLIHLFLKKNNLYETTSRKLRRFIKRYYENNSHKEITIDPKLKIKFQQKFSFSNNFFLKKNKISNKIFKYYL